MYIIHRNKQSAITNALETYNIPYAVYYPTDITVTLKLPREVLETLFIITKILYKQDNPTILRGGIKERDYTPEAVSILFLDPYTFIDEQTQSSAMTLWEREQLIRLIPSIYKLYQPTPSLPFAG